MNRLKCLIFILFILIVPVKAAEIETSFNCLNNGQEIIALNKGDVLNCSYKITNNSLDDLVDSDVLLQIGYATHCSNVKINGEEVSNEDINFTSLIDSHTATIHNQTIKKGETKEITFDFNLNESSFAFYKTNVSCSIKNLKESDKSESYKVLGYTYNEKTPLTNNGEVKTNDIITYDLYHYNTHYTGAYTAFSPYKMIITDTISKGLDYEPSSSILNSESIDDPKIEPNQDGTTSLVWTIDNPKEEINLTYSVKVNGKTKEVFNTPVISYTDAVDTIEVNSLKNIVSDYKENQITDEIKKTEETKAIQKLINAPDAASVVSITGMLIGFIMIISGIILVKKRK